MITRAEVRVTVNEAAQKYEDCWAFIASMKDGTLPSEGEGLSIVQFQPHLAQAISSLSSLYRRLKAEKERWISRKQHLSPHWFKQRMRFLDAQQSVTQQCVLVGKCIGDGFAWFFYQNNRHYLIEHLKQPEQVFMSSGVGGAAELELVKNVPHANGQFLLYHGITSILRLGDFSLIDLKNLRVVTVGELKAGKPSGGKLDVTLIFPLLKDDMAAQGSLQAPKESKVIEGLHPSSRDRFERQYKRLAESHSKIHFTPDRKLMLEMDGRIKEVEELLLNVGARMPQFLQLGSSLLLFSVQSNAATLYDRLSSKAGPSIKRVLKGLESAAVGIVLPGSSNNAIYMGSWLFREDGTLSHRPGMTHPLWWPVAADRLKRVLFHEVHVFTLLNPAHLLDALQDTGYKVQAVWPRSFKADKRVGEHMLSLGGISHYLELIQNYFFSESDILGFLAQLEEQFSHMPSEKSGQIDLHIEQHFGRPPQ